MKNNYKQLMSKSPSEPSLFKRSTSHSFRSSFRLTKKLNNVQTTTTCTSLPSFVPPKAAALLKISLPQQQQVEPMSSSMNENHNRRPLKVATIRRRSVWANSSARIRLPTRLEDVFDQPNSIVRRAESVEEIKENLRYPQIDSEKKMNEGILKEINKNTTADHFKASKKHKFGHGVKKSETNVLCALFETTENNQIDRLKNLLEKEGGEQHINTLNNDGFAPLDIAVLLDHHAIIKTLLLHGATTGIESIETVESRLNALLTETEQKLHHLPNTSTTSTSSGQNGIISDSEKQKTFYDQRIKLLKKMIVGWQNLRIPDSPFSFSVDVVGTSVVVIKILQPAENFICTKIKVQYSSREDFSIIIGDKVINEWKDFEGTMGVNFQLSNLIQGRRYYFRASSGNLKGFGSYTLCNPTSIVPSSWRDMKECDKERRITDQMETFERISNFMNLSKRESSQEDLQARRHSKKKSSIKQLFTAASKFQKTLKRGIHLACVCYSEDKVLVTNEDFIPVIEIDENYPNNLNNDFYWLMKISMSWDCVKDLRDDMERNELTKVQFRCKILNAVHQMQMALGTTDLGKFFYKPFKDVDGTVVFSCILQAKEPKSSMNLRWIPLTKLKKKCTALLEDTSSIHDILLSSIPTQITFQKASRQKLSRGLYLGYLKFFSSFDTIQVVSQAKNPNVLPNCKIRDNPHVSAEEWSALKSKSSQKSKSTLCFDLEKSGSKLTAAQEVFLDSLKLSLTRLFKFMNISPDAAVQHRLYDVEVIELDNDVTFLLICSPLAENAIVTKDLHTDTLDLSLKRNDLVCLPLIVHEMLQFNVYQHEILRKYARLSFLIEFEIIVATMKHREAFSNNEVLSAKEKLKKLQEVMNDLNSTWKNVRWMTDAISFSRTKEPSDGIDVKTILQFTSSSNLDKVQFTPPFQVPNFKMASPVRGSWSGPQLKNSDIFTYGEHSKSEQILNSCEAGRVAGLTAANLMLRNNSDSTYFSSGEKGDFVVPRLPASKSEDTLVVIRKKGPTVNAHQRKRATTINTNSNADSSYESQSSNKSNGLVVHRINNVQYMNEVPTEPQHKEESSSPAKSKLRVSHHPKSGLKKDLKKFSFESNEESTLVTFLKPTLTAIQNESQNCSFKDPLLIVEDEAIEMISSPFRKAPVGHKSNTGKLQFNRSNLHSKNVQSICQTTEAEPDDWRAFDLFKKIENSNEATTFASAKSDLEIEENLNNREYVNHSAVLENSGNSNSSSILHVIAAYQTGLGLGTSLKLKCHQKTTAKEVIELVVKQLNMAVIMKGKEGPIYDAEKLDDFCLVAVIGARERCLRPDFRPLDLQNPWKKGKLFVRLKHDLLAAIEHSNRETFSI